MILVPASAGISVAEMEKMVCEINETQVPEEEILGSHVYRYSRKIRPSAWVEKHIR